jgi:hypothetical protein
MHGYNDDLCMAAAIGLLVIDVALDELVKFQKSRLAVLDNMSRTTYSVDEMSILNVVQTKKHNPWIMQLGDEEINLSWLLDR